MSLALGLDQARISKDAQMVRDRWLREVEGRGEIADADRLRVAEPVHDRDPGRVAERLEGRAKRLRASRAIGGASLAQQMAGEPPKDSLTIINIASASTTFDERSAMHCSECDCDGCGGGCC